jgi:hypothetical protein
LEVSERIKIWIRDKIQFNWKMKSRKIRRLEFVSDKIDGGNCVREVMHTRFGHPTKKMSLVGTLHGRAAMTEVGAPWEAMGELVGEEKEGEGEGGEGVRLRARLGGTMEWLHRELGAVSWLVVAAPLFGPVHAWGRTQEGGRRREQREKRRRSERKQKEKG